MFILLYTASTGAGRNIRVRNMRNEMGSKTEGQGKGWVGGRKSEKTL